MSEHEHGFRAVIYRVGILRCVDLPEHVAEALGTSGRIPVRLTVAGKSKRTTLLPAGAGRMRICIDGAMRKAAGTATGETLELRIAPDATQGDAAAPRSLELELRRLPRLQAAFDSLTPRQRREVSGYIEAAKRADTRERRIQRALRMLADRVEGRPIRRDRS